MKVIKRYYPPVNPLPKTQPVRPTLTLAGKPRKGFLRRPKFRKGIVIGFK